MRFLWSFICHVYLQEILKAFWTKLIYSSHNWLASLFMTIVSIFSASFLAMPPLVTGFLIVWIPCLLLFRLPGGLLLFGYILCLPNMMKNSSECSILYSNVCLARNTRDAVRPTIVWLHFNPDIHRYLSNLCRWV